MIAQQLVSHLTDTPRRYASARIRSGPKHTDLVVSGERWIRPGKRGPHSKPIVCLIGPACVSSGEGMALMLKALPHVRLLGQSTRGSSGNPAPLRLPNGVIVHYSRWVGLDATGTPIEGRGVAPHVVVAHEAVGDPTFTAGVEELKRLLK